MPTHKLPKVKSCATSRKPPALRKELPPKIKHRHRDDVWRSVHSLSELAKGLLCCFEFSTLLDNSASISGDWVFFDKGESFVAELQRHHELVPQIR